MGWRGSGKVKLVLEVIFILPLPLQANLLPEVGGREPVSTTCIRASRLCKGQVGGGLRMRP